MGGRVSFGGEGWRVGERRGRGGGRVESLSDEVGGESWWRGRSEGRFLWGKEGLKDPK